MPVRRRTCADRFASVCAPMTHIFCVRKHTRSNPNGIANQPHMRSKCTQTYSSRTGFSVRLCAGAHTCVLDLFACVLKYELFFFVITTADCGIVLVRNTRFAVLHTHTHTHIHRHSRRPKVVSSKRKHTHTYTAYVASIVRSSHISLSFQEAFENTCTYFATEINTHEMRIGRCVDNAVVFWRANVFAIVSGPAAYRLKCATT